MTTSVANGIGKKVIFKIFLPITHCICEISNTQIDNAKDIEVVIPIN